MTTTNKHISVLQHEVIEHLITDKSGIYIDATFGRGGHSNAILQSLDTDAKLFAIDRDTDAIKFGTQNFQDPRLKLIHSDFSSLIDICKTANIFGKVTGIFLDLGVSSPQFDNADRGFSFMNDGPLDMRMHQSSYSVTAKDVINTYEEKQLADIFWKYGEERLSRRIAKRIVHHRSQAAINSTTQLANIVKSCIHSRQPKHPATRVFQALRIFVNQELEQLETLLEDVYDILCVKGRLAVISFHSLEDRIVKNYIKSHSLPKETDKSIPLLPGDLQSTKMHWCVRKLRPKDEEINDNTRSRSAILRVVEKL
ncbi:MAG: 16S rRNA (cytosine(1402)-N(4))-methyltransferase [Thiotrichales bacterium]|nr:MAG: 16S rRNA (cytosine(1402)-N(4))-methyltransferase [Thiotrichales bacterium]